jgi:hypothetical protein
MAGKKMVSPKTKIREMLKRVKEDKGGFYLAMLAQTSPELPDGLTLAISAPWAAADGLKRTVRYFSDKLTESLTPSELSAFDRISILDPREPLVQGIQRRTNQRLDSGQEWYEITNSSFGGVLIPQAFVFEADPYPDDSPGGGPNRNRKAAQLAGP